MGCQAALLSSGIDVELWPSLGLWLAHPVAGSCVFTQSTASPRAKLDPVLNTPEAICSRSRRARSAKSAARPSRDLSGEL